MNIFIAIIISLLSFLILFLIYSVNTRGKTVEFPSVMLWKAVPQLHRERPLLKRVLREKLFYVHFGILTFLLLALMHLSLGRSMTGIPGQRVIFIMDTSASMKTLEGETSRFDVARDKALSLLTGYKEPEAMIITAGTPARTVLPLSTDRGEIIRALENLKADDTGTSVHEAVLKTKSYVRKGDSVFLISDGAFEDLSVIVNEEPDLMYIPVGRTGDNAGILDLKIYRNDDHSGTAAAILKNYSAHPVQTTVDLMMSGTIVDAVHAEIPPESKKDIYFTNLPIKSGTIKALLNHSDSFQPDNYRYAVSSAPVFSSILLVTEDNVYIRRFLEQLENVNVTVMSPRSYEDHLKEMNGKNYDVGIFDGYTPGSETCRASIYINPDSDIKGVVRGKGRMTPVDLSAFREHPVMLHTDFSDVIIQKAQRIKSFEGIVLLASAQNPLIIVSDRPDRKQGFLGFDIKDSNFPLSVNFPVFFSNLLSWIQSDMSAMTTDTIISGELYERILPVKFRDETEAVIRSPDGNEQKIEITDGILTFPHTYQAGIYTVMFKNGTMEFAANIGPSETAIAQDAYDTSWKLRKEVRNTHGQPHAGLWKVFGLIAFLLFILEGKARKKLL